MFLALSFGVRELLKFLPVLGAAVLGLIVWPLRTSVRENARKNARFSAGARGQPTAGWNARENEAWGKVVALADSTEPLLFLETDRIVSTCRKMPEVVSYHYYREARDPWATFTLPEGLLLAERLSRDIRRVVLTILPGARATTLGQLLLAQGVFNRHGPKARFRRADRARQTDLTPASLTKLPGRGFWTMRNPRLRPLRHDACGDG